MNCHVLAFLFCGNNKYKKQSEREKKKPKSLTQLHTHLQMNELPSGPTVISLGQPNFMQCKVIYCKVETSHTVHSYQN